MSDSSFAPAQHSEQDIAFMREALKLAQQSFDESEVPVGALVVVDDQIVGRGFNCPIAQSDPTAHAELQAIRAACATLRNYRLPDATLYVTVEPCTMCLGAIVHSRIGRIVFGAYEPKAGRICSNPLVNDACFNHRLTVVNGVLEDECRELMQRFFALRREQKKALKNHKLSPT